MNSHSLILSAEQLEALAKTKAWLGTDPRSKPFFKIFGNAGSGKTTIARHIANGFPGTVAFGAYTGKAALNMVKAGCDGATTLHSLLLRPEKRGGRIRYVFNRKGGASKADLLIVDECSMIDHDLASDLLRLRKPVLLLGDPMQLPPTHGGTSPFERNPDVILKQVHRQGAGSAILDFAMAIRDGVGWEPDGRGEVSFISTEQELQAALHGVDQVIAGENGTISQIIDIMRGDKGFSMLGPQPGERLVSYKALPGKNILNGEQFEVIGPMRPGQSALTCMLDLCSLDQPRARTFTVEVLMTALREGPDDLQLAWCDRHRVAAMRYAYAITAHKAQGSQWDSVLVLDQSRSFRSYPERWLYTAVTRASNRLIVFKFD